MTSRTGLSDRLARVALVMFCAPLLLQSCTETVAPAEPQTPTDIAATLVQPTTVRLSWSARPASEYIAGYTVFRSGDSIAFVTDTQYVESNLREGVELRYAVAANSKWGIRSPVSASVPVTTRDATPPRVIQTFPADKFGPVVLTGLNLVVYFSEPMDSASVNSSTIKVESLTSGTPLTTFVRYAPNQEYATVSGNGQRLPGSATIKVTVTTGIRDLAGNHPPQDYSFTFTTDEDNPPTVISTSPPNGSQDVPLDAIVRVKFNKPLKPEISTWVAVDQGFAPTKQTSYDAATSTLTMTFNQALVGNRTYTIQIGFPFEAEDLLGNKLYYRFTFKTVDIGASAQFRTP